MKILISKTKIAAFIAAFVLTASFVSAAAPLKSVTPDLVEFKYLGEIKHQPAFELTFSSEEENGFIVTLRDNDRNVVYRDFIDAGVSGRRYILNKEELGDAPLQFEVTGRKSGKTVVFQINRDSRVIEDIMVNRIR